MTEPDEPTTKPSSITRLLLKAVQDLPEDEQRAVFAYFFERGIGVPPSPFLGQLLSEELALRGPADRGPLHVFTAQKPTGPAQQTIPVRLSEAQHRRLKAWCAEHNFPMAVVVRGLIERFLDSWDERSA